MSRALIVSCALLLAQFGAPSVEAAVRNDTACGSGTHAVVYHVVRHGHRLVRVSCVANRPVVQRHLTRRVVRHRHTKRNTALVIGGSTAAGAGIGAAVGGSKGALIGAATGAAGSAAYEAHKHHRPARR